MLNWDEYGKDENSSPPVVSEPKTEIGRASCRERV